jgi:hypothetical protein
MNDQIMTLLIILGIPFVSLVACWIALMITMYKTTGELKHWLTPDNVIKGIAIIFVVMSVLTLAVLKILNGDVIATILSGIIGYTLGTKFIER